MDPMLFIDRIFQYGLPTVLLAAFCWAVWRAVSWAGVNVVIPLRDRAIAYLDTTSATMQRLADTSEAQGKLLAEVIASLARLNEAMNSVQCLAPLSQPLHQSPHKPPH